MLQCRGCKDREKHNKVRCRRCEERDKKKNEERKDKDKVQNDDGDRSEKNFTNKHDDSENGMKIGDKENKRKLVEISANRCEVIGAEERDKKKNEVRKEKDKDQNIDGDRSEKKVSNKHDSSIERSAHRSEVVDKNTVILGRPDEDSSYNENIASCELDLPCKTRAKNFEQDIPSVQIPGCLKPHSNSNLVSTHGKVQPCLEPDTHEHLGKVDRDKIFDDSEDEADADSQDVNDSAHTEPS